MEHHLRPLLIIAVCAVLLAGAGYMLWPQASKAPTMQEVQDNTAATSGLPPGADPNTFVSEEGGLYFTNNPASVQYDARDKYHYYLNGTIVGTNVFTSDGSPTYYQIVGDKVYVHSGQSHVLNELSGADPKSFTVLAYGEFFDSRASEISIQVFLSKDASHVYSYNKLISGADAATFEPISTPMGGLSEYAKDKNHAYYYDQVISSDPETFQVTSGVEAHDKDSNFFNGQVVQ